jgi:hypothetical protein
MLINSGEHAHLENKAVFSFELSWLREDGFVKMIKIEWNLFVKGNSPIEVWENKIRHLRCFLKGWARHRSGFYRKEKEILPAIIDELDFKVETCPLNIYECGIREMQMIS